jgi:hypothetical protein
VNVLRDLAAVTVALVVCAASMVCAMNAWVRNDSTIGIKDEIIRVSLTADELKPSVGAVVKMRVVITGTFGRGNTVCLTPWWTVDTDSTPREGRTQNGQRVVVCGPPFVPMEQPVVFPRDGAIEVRLHLRTQSGMLFREEKLVFDVRPISAAR